MDVFTLFEQRTNDAFKGLPQTSKPAIPFKKVGRQVVKAMRKGAFVMDGSDAVPALYTILVSPEDDHAMMLAYPRLTQEIELLVASQAEESGFMFVGEPLARFVADEGVRPKGFAVVADNVDSRTLERLRDDEQGGQPGGHGRRRDMTGGSHRSVAQRPIRQEGRRTERGGYGRRPAMVR